MDSIRGTASRRPVVSRVVPWFFLVALLTAGCSGYFDEKFPGDIGPGSNSSTLALGFTNSNPRHLASGSLGYSRCSMVITGIEVSPDESTWFKVWSSPGVTVELADPAKALDAVTVVGSKSAMIPDFLSAGRVTVTKLTRDTVIPVDFVANSDNPFDRIDPMLLKAKLSFSLAPDKTTLFIFDIDSSQEMTGIREGGLSVEARAMFTEIRLLPYLEPLSDRDGVWSNGTVHGYYKGYELKDSNSQQIATLAFGEGSNEARYLITNGKYKGVSGKAFLEVNAFAKYSRILFVMDATHAGGMWLSDQVKAEGYFAMNSYWPYATSAVMTNFLGYGYGALTFRENRTFHKVTGDWTIDGSAEKGVVFVY